MARLRGHNRVVRLTGGQGAADPLVAASGAKRRFGDPNGRDQRRNSPNAWRYVRLGGGQSVDVDELRRWINRRRRRQRAQIKAGAEGKGAHARVLEQALLVAILKKLHLARPTLTPEERHLVRALLAAEAPESGGQAAGGERDRRRTRSRVPAIVRSSSRNPPMQSALARLARHYDRLGESSRAKQTRAWARRLEASAVPPPLPSWLTSALAELEGRRPGIEGNGNPTHGRP